MTLTKDKRLLSPIDRISEILFGLIMALTFTCTISVIDADRAAVREMLIGAIGCNIAWGLVDAVMYLLMTLTEKSRGETVYRHIRKAPDKKEAHQAIAEALPPVLAEQLNETEYENLRQKLLQLPEYPDYPRLRWKDFKTAFGIFLLVFLSTFPVAVPFIFIDEVERALRLSNAIAIGMMFLCGWILARYSGSNRFAMGLIMSLVGVALVAATIALGG